MNNLTLTTGWMDKQGCMHSNENDRTLPIKECLDEFKVALTTMNSDKIVELGYWDQNDDYQGLVTVIGGMVEIQQGELEFADRLDKLCLTAIKHDNIIDLLFNHYNNAGQYSTFEDGIECWYDSYLFQVEIH